MIFLYFYLRNIIKYGKTSEHVVYQPKIDMFFLLRFNHINLKYDMDFDGRGYTVNTTHQPQLVKHITSGTQVEYLGQL